MEKNFNLMIDVKKAAYNVVRGLKQGDNNSVLNVTFTQNSLPFDLTGLTVRANYRRPDHHIFLQETSIIEPKKGQLKINILTQALEFAGEVLGDLSIFEGDRKITSVSFSIFVDASVYRNDYIDPEQLDIIQKVFANEVKRNGETSKITEDYLKYKNIMTAESNVAALQNNIDKITNGLGGRNLVVDSTNLTAYFGRYNFEGTIQKLADPYPASKGCFKVECTKTKISGETGGFYFTDVSKNLIREKTYTYSLYIFSTTPKTLTIGMEGGRGAKEFTIGKGWQKISYTWVFSDVHSFIFYTRADWNIGDTIYIADLKIEEGTVPTTWTPAPEDIDKLIGDVSKLKMSEFNLADAVNFLYDRKAPITHNHTESDITSALGQWLLPTGCRKFPGGLILQWGTAVSGVSTGFATGQFPTAFPTACFAITANIQYDGQLANNAATTAFVTIQANSNSVYNLYFRNVDGRIPNISMKVNWIALGF